MSGVWKFILVQDNDGHWYVIPQPRISDWQAWLDVSHLDDGAWDLPSYATEVGGHPSLVTFERFEIDGVGPSDAGSLK